MYKYKDKIEKKIKSMVNGIKVLFLFSSFLFLSCLCLVVWGNGKLINLIPISLFMVIWFLSFHLIYAYIAYKIPIEISINSGKFTVKCKARTYLFDLKDFVFRGDGVNNILLKFKIGKNKFTFYLPKFYGDKENLNNKDVFCNFNVQKSKIKYDFFLRFF